MVGDDGTIPESVLIGVREAGYDGIEPNCYHVQHLYRIVDVCQHVGIRIHAIPTGRWMNLAAAPADYGRYTQHAFECLNEGASIAASLDVPLILGLIRGPSSVADVEAEAFLSSVIHGLVQRTPQLKILVEPIAAAEACWPHTIEQGDRLLKRLKQPQVKLLADSYHIARSGEAFQIEHYRDSIGHLHIRDDQKQIPTRTAPEYGSILRLWREDNRILSFEPTIELRHTVAHAIAGARWITHELRHS
jgi:sugar phosphate isomerase/epimerase